MTDSLVSVASKHLFGLRERLDDRQLRQARALTRRLRKSTTTILYFGESTLSHVAPADVDRRCLPEILADRTRDIGQILPIHGAGYHPGLYNAYLDLARSLHRPRAVVVSLCIRMRQTPWVHHPVYGYARSHEKLEASAERSARLCWATSPRPTPDEFKVLDARSYSTRWSWRTTVGEHRAVLRDLDAHSLTGDDHSRVLINYYHGQVIDAETPELVQVTDLGRRLYSLGVPVVIYQNPVNVEFGERLWPDDFRAHVERNFQTLELALHRGWPAATVLQTGTALTPSAFIDSRDGTEHLNEEGRRYLADVITAALRRQVAG